MYHFLFFKYEQKESNDLEKNTKLYKSLRDNKIFRYIQKVKNI